MRCSDCAQFRARWQFLFIACAVTWGVVSPLAFAARRSEVPAVPLWWHALGALGPLVAAWIAVRRADGSEGVAEWRARVLDWRVGWRWWSVAVGLPFVVLGSGALLVQAGATRTAAAFNPDGLGAAWQSPVWRWQLLGLGSLAYGLLEEPGWRGWLYPHLRMQRGPLAATLVLWPMWLLWHAPFFTYQFAASPWTMAGFAFGLLCSAIVLSWLVEETGSAAPAMGFHVANNIAMAIAAVSSPGALVMANLVLAAVAAAIVTRWWLVPRRAQVAFENRALTLVDHPTAQLH